MTASRNRLNRLNSSRPQEQQQEQMENAEVWQPPVGLNLEIENDDDQQNEEDQHFIISSKKLQESLLRIDQERQNADQEMGVKGGITSDKGKLVQQLMATKSELEGVVGQTTETIQQEPESQNTGQLRTNVHQLIQSIGGLSRALNYLHEDVDPMLLELEKWRTDYGRNVKEIERLKREAEKERGPLRKELDAVEFEVKEWSEKLQNAKASVYRDSLAIGKLIESV